MLDQLLVLVSLWVVYSHREDILRITELVRIRHIVATLLSNALFCLAFVQDYLHQKLDTASMQQRREILHSYSQFLRKNGVEQLLREAFGQRKTLCNLLVLRQIHKRLFSSFLHEASTNRLYLNDHDEEEASRFFKFSTAIYGHDIVAAVEYEANPEECTSWTTTTTPSRHRCRRVSHAFCSTTGICNPADILVRNWDYGGSCTYANHAVVVDHRHRCIVFTVRGTLSLSDAIADFQGNATPFCGGQAHAGIARMAVATWEKATETCDPLFSSVDESYELVFTGHSLGAGIATLIAVKVLHGGLVGQRRVRCFAYAPPATFHGELSTSIRSSINAYTNGNDCVPYISVHSVRHLCSSLNEIEKCWQ